MLDIYYKSTKDRKPKKSSDFKVGSWIVAQQPNEEEIKRLTDEFKLEPGLIHDALDPLEVPRMEVNEGIVYVYTRVPFDDNNRWITVPVMIAVASNYIAVASSKKLDFIDKFVSNGYDYSTTQKTKLLVQLFAEINKVYQRFVTDISKRVRGTVVNLSYLRNRDIVQFVRYEEILNDFLSSLTSTNSVLNKLLNGRAISFYESDRDLIEDMFLSNGQLIESANNALKNIKNIREAYSTIMTQDLNRIIKVLTVLTILLNVPVLVSSLYGMNVALPGSENPAAFWWIVWSTGAVTVLLLLLFLKKQWLR